MTTILEPWTPPSPPKPGRLSCFSLLLLSSFFVVDCARTTDRNTLVIYHHGSPTPAIEAAERVFSAKYPHTQVVRERDDALSNMRKVTDLGKLADLVFTDDYSIIQPVMFPRFADFWILYAHDKMTIAYGPNSRYASEISADNWYNIIQRKDVKWGIADPNAGPDGYFSLGQIMLSNLYYKNSSLFRNIISVNSDITVTEANGTYIIDCPENLAPKPSTMLLRPDPEALYPMILAGEIDYAFGYMGSVIGEGPAGIKTLDLPREIDLSDLSLASSTYNRVKINLFSDKPGRRIPITLGAKANGLTIPRNAQNPEAAVEFLRIFLGQVGREALMGVHITPVVPAITNDLTKVPEALHAFLREAPL